MTDNLTEQSKKIIRNAIIYGELKLGESISEIGICNKYGLQKTPVREALIILSIEGLVKKVRRRGSFVFDITVKEIEQIAELRYLLEEFALKKSFVTNKNELLSELNSIYKKMEVASNTKDYIKYLDLDTEFHRAFFKHCDNDYLKSNYDNLSSKVEALRFYVVQIAVDSGEGLESHKQIIDSIESNDNVQLSRNLKEHLTAWLNKYKSDFSLGF